MLLEADGVQLTGASTSNRTDHGRLTWVDNVEAATPTEYWRFGRHPTSGNVELTNLETDTTALEARTDGEVVVGRLGVTGQITRPIHFAGEHTQLSGFDADGRHWVHAGATKTADQVLAIEHRADSDYRLHVSEGDTLSRVLTGSDLGDVDAGTLDGLDSAAFMQADGSVPASAPIDFGGFGLTGVGDIAGAGPLTLTAGGTTAVSVSAAGDVAVPAGGLTVGGTSVATIDQTGLDVENTQGTPLVTAADAITAGTDLSFSDDGDGTATLSFTGDVAPSSAAVGDQPTASGDGAQTVFTLAHSLGAIPDAVSVDAASPAASTDFRVSGVTDTTVEITYESAPPSGTDNLAWHVTTTASGAAATTVSDDGATVVPNPFDLNFGAGLAASDDGDQSVTLATDGSVGHLDQSETATAHWRFEPGMEVGPDADLAVADANGTAQFGVAYDSTNDRMVIADRANTTPIAYVDRAGTWNFQQNVQLNGTDLATAGGDLANSGSGSAPAEAVPEADGNGNIQWTRRTEGASETTSGDGTTTTFTITHGLGTTPGAATVTPTTPAASGDFYVSNKTTTDVVVTYHRAPPSGTDNLAWDVTVHA